MKRADEGLNWQDVSLYRNPFDDVIARELLTPAIRAKLVALKDFEYADPGLDYPAWKLDAVNHLKNRQIAAILA